MRFAVHPVAGRMPGHMHVLLAEAEVEYEKLFEMQDINDDFASTDVVLVVGACDVVNPAAVTTTDTPISGMPILNAHDAGAVIVCNLDEKPGYSGVPNPLYDDPKAILLFGDAKGTLEGLIAGLENPAAAAARRRRAHRAQGPRPRRARGGPERDRRPRLRHGPGARRLRGGAPRQPAREGGQAGALRRAPRGRAHAGPHARAARRSRGRVREALRDAGHQRRLRQHRRGARRRRLRRRQPGGRDHHRHADQRHAHPQRPRRRRRDRLQPRREARLLGRAQPALRRPQGDPPLRRRQGHPRGADRRAGEPRRRRRPPPRRPPSPRAAPSPRSRRPRA